MSEWRERRLEDVVQLKRGFDLATRERRPGPFPVVGSAGISGWHDEGPILGPALVLGRAGSSMGVASYCETERFWPLNTSLFVEDFKGNDPRFIFHLFQLTDLTGYNSGSAQPMLNRNYIRDVVFLMPDLEEQRAISNVLKALDDKIAVNERIAKTSVSLSDSIHQMSAAGPGFNYETFGTVASVYGGGTPSTTEPSYWDGNIAWTTPTDVTGLGVPYLFKTARRITESGLANCASHLYPAGSIFMTSRATIGAFAVPQMSAAVNQGFIVVVPPRDELRWWLFHEMRSRVDEMLSLANGSTFLELSRKNFKSMQVRVAPLDELKQFDVKVAPLHQRAAQAMQESASLKEIRDTLLPRLMSGEVHVRDAEKIVEDVT
jgi:type I restriction enzyme, S subunit